VQAMTFSAFSPRKSSRREHDSKQNSLSHIDPGDSFFR
jgi:hypothetical protein